MSNLRLYLQLGAQGVDSDPVRAAQLYTRAVYEGGEYLAISNLACLLQYGAERVDANHVRAEELFESAIDAGVENSMVDQARLLTKGTDGIDADHTRAIALYSHVIEEGSVKKQICIDATELSALQRQPDEAADRTR